MPESVETPAPVRAVTRLPARRATASAAVPVRGAGADGGTDEAVGVAVAVAGVTGGRGTGPRYDAATRGSRRAERRGDGVPREGCDREAPADDRRREPCGDATGTARTGRGRPGNARLRTTAS